MCFSTGPTREVEISLRFPCYIQVGYEVSYHGMRNEKMEGGCALAWAPHVKSKSRYAFPVTSRWVMIQVGYPGEL